jgi:hypothetical protein
MSSFVGSFSKGEESREYWGQEQDVRRGGGGKETKMEFFGESFSEKKLKNSKLGQ